MSGIECGCVIEAYDAEHPSVMSERVVVARKEHKCCECYGTIQPGEKYELVKGCWDGSWSTYKTCMPCVGIRREHCCSWAYGRLREHIWDALQLDYLIADPLDPDEDDDW